MSDITLKCAQLNPLYVESALKILPPELSNFFRSDSISLLREKTNRIWHFVKTGGVWINERKIDSLLLLNKFEIKPIFPKKSYFIPQTYIYGIPERKKFPAFQTFQVKPKTTFIPPPKPKAEPFTFGTPFPRNAFERAIEENDCETLRRFLDQKIKLDEGYPPLLRAIRKGNVEAVKMLLEFKANPRARYGNFSIYVAALQQPKPEIMEALLEHGFRYQDRDDKINEDFRLTLLANASVEVLELFIKKGLKAELDSSTGAYHILYSEKKFDHLEAFHQNGIKGEDYSNWIRQKFLAHRFDVSVPDLKLESFDHHRTLSEMYESLQEFFKHFPAHYTELTKEARNQILSSFEYASKEDEFDTKDLHTHRLSRYEQGEPVLIPAGWDTHAIYRVAYKRLLLECNRGAQFEEETPTGLQIHTFETLKKEDLKRAKCKSSLSAAHQASSLLYQNLKAEKVIQFKYKAHKKGICAWAGLKTAFRGILFVLITEELQRQGYSINRATNQAQRIGNKIYKTWSKWDREQELLKALRYYEAPDAAKPNLPLLKLIKKKFHGSKKTRDLLTILINSPQLKKLS
ncbi:MULTISPECIES: ankyrin repeat domain-containing protein [Parachlamydia]|uniref:ankyrin repeat domain-containing protein n=1 Tax=Parachlamydia TaxID=83551 RepID=UPI0001C17C9D|nr:ankyrin repeat domain-containing protein [Parachlamydia acanthamoebae]EFB42178.1 hypothetical protein pah_c014o110 [Parachlamydia acanthamoebae str. Hall's coccus]